MGLVGNYRTEFFWTYISIYCSTRSLTMNIPYTAAHGTTRFSLSRYNTMQEVEEVIAAIPPIMEKLRKLSPYWGENGPVEEPEKAFAPTYA